MPSLVGFHRFSFEKGRNFRENNGMQSTPGSQKEMGWPAGLRAALLAPRAEFALPIALVARAKPEPGAAPFIILRAESIATVYLGALLDAQGNPVELLEIWVQTTPADHACGHARTLPNSVWDGVWLDRWRASWANATPDRLISGYEQAHPGPMWYDPDQGTIRNLTDDGWRLCTDDARLTAANLPAYSTSSERFLVNDKSADALSATPAGVAQLLPNAQKLVPFNLGCGYIAVTRLFPAALDEFADLLSGRIPPMGELTALGFPERLHALAGIGPERLSAGTFFTQSNQRGGRLAEVFHLKILLIARMFAAVRHAVKARQMPLLNVSPDSFRVRFASGGFGLPFLWSGEVSLAQGGEAHPLEVSGGEGRYFVLLGSSETTIFRPQGEAMRVRGMARNISLRSVIKADAGGHVLDGTIRTDESLVFSENDLLWMDIPFQVSTGLYRVAVYARLQAEESGGGEYAFRTLPTKLPDVLAPVLAKSERFGAMFHKVPFELIPFLSTPIDLYSLAVIALRILVVNSRNSLPESLDRLLSLISAVKTGEAGEPLRARIAKAFGVDLEGNAQDAKNKFIEALGPHRLVEAQPSASEAFQLLPPDLWFAALEFLISCLPAAAPESFCKDFGDVSPHALETVFDRPLKELDLLATKSRSLVTLDWSLNRELQSVLGEYIG